MRKWFDAEGDGSGPTNFAVGDGPYSVAVGDFNGDGNPDSAVANYWKAAFKRFGLLRVKIQGEMVASH